MRRRELLTILSGAATLALPVAVYGQQRVLRIGVLMTTTVDLLGPYREALSDLGYVEGKDIQYEVRSAQGQIGRLPELASELVRVSSPH